MQIAKSVIRKYSQEQKKVSNKKPQALEQEKPPRLPSSYLSGGATAIAFIAFGIWLIEKRAKQMFWISKAAVVESCSQVNDKTWNVVYSFELDNERIDEKQQVHQSYNRGQTVTAYVNPKHPYNNNVIKKAPITELTVGIVFLMLGLYCVKKLI